jgi:hypothetical protein
MNGGQICVSCGVGVRLPGSLKGIVSDVGARSSPSAPIQQFARRPTKPAFDVLVASGAADGWRASIASKHQLRRGILQRTPLRNCRAARSASRAGASRGFACGSNRLRAQALFRCAELRDVWHF